MKARSSLYKTNLHQGRRLNEDFFLSLISKQVKKFDNIDRALIVMSRKSSGTILGLVQEIINFGSMELNAHANKLYKLIRKDMRKTFNVKSFILIRNWKRANRRIQGVIKFNKNVLEALDNLRMAIEEIIRKEHYFTSLHLGKPTKIWLGIYEKKGLEDMLELVNQAIETDMNLIELDTKVLKRYHETYYNDLYEAKNALFARKEEARRASKEVVPRIAEERRPSAKHELKHEISTIENEIACIDAELRTLR